MEMSIQVNILSLIPEIEQNKLKVLKIPENKCVVKNQHKHNVEGSKEKRVWCECEYRNCPKTKT